MKRKLVKSPTYYVISEDNLHKARGTGWVRPHWTVRGSVTGFYKKKYGVHKKVIPSPWRWFRNWAKRGPSPEGG